MSIGLKSSRNGFSMEEMPRKKAVSEYLASIGRKGGKASGKARMEKLTPEKRSELARQAAMARWKRASKSPSPLREKP